MYIQIFLTGIAIALVNGDHHERTYQLPDRSTIVHLFEWKWRDIADECERFLAPKGFGGVQISPPSENLIIHTANGKRPWYERYQVMSYKLETRSGNEEDFLNMTTRCNNVGIRIYAVVINHMTGDQEKNIGTGGSTANFFNYSYPGVPSSIEHFHHPFCAIDNDNDAHQVRVGAAQHMWPEDLRQIYKRLQNLNTQFGFASNSKPYVYQQVICYGNEAIKPDEYAALGDVTEFKVGAELKSVFRGANAMKWMVNWGEGWGLAPSDTALSFIDSHDTQRSNDVLTYKEPKAYKAAIAFMLAQQHGEPRILSSYLFEARNQGPPSDSNENIISPSINCDETCGNGYVCEHRWRQIYQMVEFRNVVRTTNVINWWDNGNKQIGFSRGNKGFIVINGQNTDMDQVLQTGLPPGEFYDVISGWKINGGCTGIKISVNKTGFAHFQIPGNHEDMHVAIHVGSESRLFSLHSLLVNSK